MHNSTGLFFCFQCEKLVREAKYLTETTIFKRKCGKNVEKWVEISLVKTLDPFFRLFSPLQDHFSSLEDNPSAVIEEPVIYSQILDGVTTKKMANLSWTTGNELYK